MQRLIYLLLLWACLFQFSCNHRKISKEGAGNIEEVPGYAVLGIKELMAEAYTQMKATRLTGDPDYDLLSLLSIHHHNGIALAEAQVRRGHNIDLVIFAREISDEQQELANIFSDFLKNRRPQLREKEYRDKTKKLLARLKPELDQLQLENNIDEDFPEIMALHQKHAIDFANLLIEYGTDNAIKNTTGQIIENQKNMINVLGHY